VFRDRHGNAIHLGERDGCAAAAPEIDRGGAVARGFLPVRARMGAVAVAAVNRFRYEVPARWSFCSTRAASSISWR
jgi:hypothetical protein